jgi:hypothetical protein
VQINTAVPPEVREAYNRTLQAAAISSQEFLQGVIHYVVEEGIPDFLKDYIVEIERQRRQQRTEDHLSKLVSGLTGKKEPD